MTEAPTIFITGATDGLGRALAGRLDAFDAGARAELWRRSLELVDRHATR